MPVYQLSEQLIFPPAEHADESGLLCIGGNAQPERLILAYSQGIFPWPHEGYPLLWFSPNPRFVIPLHQFHISRSLTKEIVKNTYEIKLDTAFEQVMQQCAQTPRHGEKGTWITQELIDGYTKLHQLGYAHSIEAWNGPSLVGGLYGVSLGRAFFGESMFACAPSASKVAFAYLLAHLNYWHFDFVDCQVYTNHLARFGAQSWERDQYLTSLRHSMSHPPKREQWHIELNKNEVLTIVKKYSVPLLLDHEQHIADDAQSSSVLDNKSSPEKEH